MVVKIALGDPELKRIIYNGVIYVNTDYIEAKKSGGPTA